MRVEASKIVGWLAASVTLLLMAVHPARAQLGPCIGDCNRDGQVTVDELVKGVQIALGELLFDACPEFDRNGDFQVTVDELVSGVTAALDGCVPLPTLTPTHTATELPSPTATESPTSAPTPTATDTPTPPATATATCAPTGTPYCSDQCQPCPTIRADCYAVACGTCLQNPTTCPEGQVRSCSERNCCTCVEATETEEPTATETPEVTETPEPTETESVSPVPTPTGTPTHSPTGIVAPTESPTAGSPEPTNTPTLTGTPTQSRTPTATQEELPTATLTAPATATETMAEVASPTPTSTTIAETSPTATPTASPTTEPTVVGQCDDFDECTVMDTCQLDGTCRGTPKQNGTACDDGNPCTINDSCQQGRCSGGVNAPNGAVCALPGLGPCVQSAQCFFGACVPVQLVQCPPSGDLCHPNVCNPLTGQCIQITINCDEDCATAQCDPQTGECINRQIIADKQCDDGNECTVNDLCVEGECVGGQVVGAPTPTPTLSPTAGSPPPTATATDTPTRTATVPVIATPTPSATTGGEPGSPTPTPTVTNTPGAGAIRQAGGAVVSTSNAMLVIPKILSALLGHIPSPGAGSGAGLFPLGFTCPGGGGGTVSCNPLFGGPPTYLITLSSCVVPSGQGSSITFTGSMSASAATGSCLSFTFSEQLLVEIPSLMINSVSPAGSTMATFTDVVGSVALSGSDLQCTYNQVELNLVGTVAVVSKTPENQIITSTSITFFSGSSIIIVVTTFGSQCVPVVYQLTLDGGAGISSGGNSYTAQYSEFTLTNDASSGVDMIEVGGQIASDCFGGTVGFDTAQMLALLPDDVCPIAGIVNILAIDPGRVHYLINGGVDLDFGPDDVIDQSAPSCLVLVADPCVG
jgi:hypothetical protein